mmetsp:Transcript_6793/g.12561  ORF Transcript_6793/g.12561 Transcript_6793/m.12561 type:complete len:294 (-) Transcript_6793:50-931(-)
MGRQPVLFIGHGAGPMFVLESDNPAMKAADRNSPGAKALRNIWGDLYEGESAPYQEPKAILWISAHWEGDQSGVFEILDFGKGPANPLYDYYGFPKAAYDLEYPCPGDPALNDKVKSLLRDAGLKVKLTSQATRKGLDHGVFIPGICLNPRANIPTVQVSLDGSLSAENNCKMAAALSSLRDEGVLIVGSGMTVHNFALGDRAEPSSTKVVSVAKKFQDWVDKEFTKPHNKPGLRPASVNWEKLGPGARLAHSREEHLLPFFMADAAAGSTPAQKLFEAWFAAAFPINAYIWT